MPERSNPDRAPLSFAEFIEAATAAAQHVSTGKALRSQDDPDFKVPFWLGLFFGDASQLRTALPASDSIAKREASARVPTETLARVVTTANTPEFGRAIEVLRADPSARAYARSDPEAFLRGHGVALDANTHVKVSGDTETPQGSWTICLNAGPVSVCYNF